MEHNHMSVRLKRQASAVLGQWEGLIKWGLNFGFSAVVVLILLYMGRDFLSTMQDSITTMRDAVVRIETSISEMKNISQTGQTALEEIRRHDREARERDLAVAKLLDQQSILLQRLMECLDSRNKPVNSKPVPAQPTPQKEPG